MVKYTNKKYNIISNFLGFMILLMIMVVNFYFEIIYLNVYIVCNIDNYIEIWN